MKQLPEFKCYTNHLSNNYGLNSLVFTDSQGNRFYFSYQTLVAFYSNKTGLVCIENLWSATTGKHLNAIQPDKSKRVNQETFERLYNEAFNVL